MIPAWLTAGTPCEPAVDWIESQGSPPPEQLWQRCPRGDWLLWVALHLGVDSRLVVEAACDCVEPVLIHIPAGEERPRRAIETARRWTRGEATIAEIRAAYAAADAYASAANAAALAAGATHATISRAAAVSLAARATYPADHGAAAVLYVANSDGARAASLARSADLVRARIPWSAVEAAPATPKNIVHDLRERGGRRLR